MSDKPIVHITKIWRKDGSVEIFDAKGCYVGKVIGDCLFVEVDLNRCLLRSPLGWYFDLATLDSAKEEGAKAIEILNLRTGCTYHAYLSDFFYFGTISGFDIYEKIFLPTKYWVVWNFILNVPDDPNPIMCINCRFR